jgi:hypothetical protein
MGGGARTEETIGAVLAALGAKARAGAAGADLGGGLAGAAGRARAAAPLFASSGGEDASPAGAARASDMSAAASHAVQTDSAPVPEVTPTSAPISVSDRVRTGGSEAFNAANAADPASLASAPQDALAQLTAVRSARETLRLAQDLENLFAEDQPPRLPPTPPTMKLSAGRARPAQPPKAAPRTQARRALALSGVGGQQAQLRRLLTQLLKPHAG